MTSSSQWQSRQRHANQKDRKKESTIPKNMRRTDKSGVSEAVCATPREWCPSTHTALKALLSARLCSAVWAIITDCDEAFNYWEPTHYLVYGWGFQTWEYSPQFALRSYFYLMLQAAPAWLYDALITSNRVMVYFFVRCLLAMLSSACELYFYRGVVSVYGGRVGRFTLCLQVFSAGMFAASTAYLPSSFAMQAVSMGVGAWLHGQYQLAILCVAIAALLGWPFTALLGLPIAYDIAVRKKKIKLFVKWTFISAFVILMPMIQVDTAYYGRMLVTPLKLILYNVFTSHGPDLYGTEPWHYYLVNGFLNFNVAFLLAIAAAPICMLYRRWSRDTVPAWLVLSPLYLWLAVFQCQPHKEERFLYPVYTLVCLAAALAIDSLQHACERLPWRAAGKVCSHLSLVLLVASCTASVSRSLAQYRGYHAPLSVFLELPGLPSQGSVTRLCLAKEWHRFPSSFFVPDGWEVRFVQSEFRGQLPQPFLAQEGATSLIRDNFNDLNKEETDRYVAASSCHYLIDQTTSQTTELEPRYADDVATWRSVTAYPFLDKTRSPRLLRAFYVPYLSELYCTYNNYTLLQNVGGNSRRRSKS